MAKKTLYTKALEILVGVYTQGPDGTLTAPTSGDALDNVIADSLSITQDDADKNTIDCETSDSPILTNYTAGAVKVDLNNASIDSDFLTKVMGWVEVTLASSNTGYAMPETYTTRYIALQVKFANGYLYLPKISIAPKLVFESLKSNVAYGTLSGTAEVVEIGENSNKVRTAMATLKAAVLTKAAG